MCYHVRVWVSLSVTWASFARTASEHLALLHTLTNVSSFVLQDSIAGADGPGSRTGIATAAACLYHHCLTAQV